MSIDTTQLIANLSQSKRPLIGVFDSGVGGLSVLKALHLVLPEANFLYVADSGHAPYGEKPLEFIVERSEKISQFLKNAGAIEIVVACNTATAAACQILRQNDPSTPYIGVEPGIKPALAISTNKKIGVMATQRTLQSDKFSKLLSSYSHQAEFYLRACNGLAAAIESIDSNEQILNEILSEHCSPLRAAGVDTVVLGCTHYPFVSDKIRKLMGNDIQIIDTSEAIARQAKSELKKLLSEHTRPDTSSQMPQTLILTTGSIEKCTEVCKQWIDFPVNINQIHIH